MRTNHNSEITLLRLSNLVEDQLAADLLGLHDSTALSLDSWSSATMFIAHRIGVLSANPDTTFVLQKNGA
jgi:hypothetical protein